MAKVVFYEKPGCAGNAGQKALLTRSGHEIDARNLLDAPWTAASLRSFFGDRPVSEWFNRAAPRIKSGEIDPDAMTPDAALAEMVAHPLLIRRPLLQVGERREVGFVRELIADWIGLNDETEVATEACLRGSPPRTSCKPPADQRREGVSIENQG